MMIRLFDSVIEISSCSSDAFNYHIFKTLQNAKHLCPLSFVEHKPRGKV